MKSILNNLKTYLVAIIVVLAVIAGAWFYVGSLMENLDKIKPDKGSAFSLNSPITYDQPLLMKLSDFAISILPLGAQSAKAQTTDNVVKYINAYPNTDVVQTRSFNKLKEDIILKQPGHPAIFEYQIDMAQFDVSRDSPGNLYFFKKGHIDDNDYKLFTIPAPFMIDANGQKSSTADVLSALNGAGRLVLKPSAEWLAKAKYPVILDPTIEISVINVHSHPAQGDNWTVDFTTQGAADLKIIPIDQATVDDDEFVSLSCNGEKRQPQILAGDVIFYPNWNCSGTATVIHYTKTAGSHTLKFDFGGQISYAYNSSCTFCATGGTITYSGGYTIHTFTSSGTFTVTGSGNVEYLVVAGGGGGGGAQLYWVGGAGGGGGGMKTGTLAVTAGAKTVTVGAGGDAGPQHLPGGSGGNSVFDSITSTGGGGGGTYGHSGLTGGSGGGGNEGTGVGSGTGSEGNAGATYYSISAGEQGGGGGGKGAAASSYNGGVGEASSISGVSTYYAGGGGGSGTEAAGTGGNGGGANGVHTANNGNPGTANTGGGGSGGMSSIVDYGAKAGGAGGSGIVIVRYIPTYGTYSPVVFRTTAVPTADQYTKLLLHADGTDASFVDSASIPKAVTANGDATQSATQSKFGGKSAYFDGTGDYLSVTDSDDWQLNDTWTIDFWVYSNAATSQGYIGQVVDGSNGWGLRSTIAGSNLEFSIDYLVGGEWYITWNNFIQTGGWHHVAIVRNGATVKAYYDGAEQTITGSGGTIANFNNYATPLMVGGSFAPSFGTPFTANAYMDEVRISKGIARWTSNFTPPTSAYTSGTGTAGQPIVFRTAATDAYTKLLLHADGTTTSFVDSESIPKTITAVADATQSATQSKFGGKSAYFDGTGDYLSLADSEDWYFGTGNFTIDFWMNSTSAQDYMNILSQSVGEAWIDVGINIRVQAADKISFSYGGASSHADFLISTTDVVDGTWHHVAVVRSGNTATLYIDGASEATGDFSSDSSILDKATVLKIGQWEVGIGRDYGGYLDELRVSKGVARWTANFTPPTSAYSSTGSTVILK